MARRNASAGIGEQRARSVGWPSPAIITHLRELLAARDRDPAQVPDEPFRIMRLPEVKQKVGLSTSSIYRGINAGTFPKPIPIDRASSVRELVLRTRR